MASGTDPAQPLAVVLLTRERCSLCEQTKVLLDRLATEYPLAVTSLDVEESAGQALAEHSAIPFAPAVLLGEAVFAYGRISERSLRREIERLAVPALASPRLTTKRGTKGRPRPALVARLLDRLGGGNGVRKDRSS